MPLFLARMLAVVFILIALKVAFPHRFAGPDGAAQLSYAGLMLLLGLAVPLMGRIAGSRLAVAGAVWIVAFVTIVAGYTYRTDLSAAYERAIGRTEPLAALARAPGEVELTRTWDGHFRALTEIGGAEVGLLIDTGASIVLLRHEDAEAIGIDTAALQFTMPITTANGGARVAPITLDRVRIGDVEVRNVRAGVAQRGALHSGLLGMSFLNELSELSFRGDRVILKN